MVEKDRKHINSRDAALFKDLVGDVKPLKSRSRYISKSAPAAPSKVAGRAQPSIDTGRFNAPEPALVTANELVSYARDGVSSRLLRALRRGRYPVQAEIDLHGMTSAEALAATNDFLTECAARRIRCVRIVHGKGLGSGERGPVLKNAINYWLRQFDNVLAFCSAPATDGGAGAVYVYLKRF